MFFSADDFYNYATRNPDAAAAVQYCTGEFTKSNVRKYVKVCKEAIVQRYNYAEFDRDDEELYKWFRPWDVVPKLRNYSAPAGDFGVGVEIELGFTSSVAAYNVARAVRNWRNVALDMEGPGSDPIEATFPPFNYSKLSSKRQPFKYLKLVRSLGGVMDHRPEDMVGTHVNVSVGEGGNIDAGRVDMLANVLGDISSSRDTDSYWTVRPTAEALKYFGRRPYGTCNLFGRRYIEYKLFNSTTDSKVLKRYIHEAVELTKLVVSNSPINRTTALAALEAGYNKR